MNLKLFNGNKVIRWFEPLGLSLLLFAFGWQCLQEQASQLKTEGLLLETNEKLISIWSAEYDEALRSERYTGKSVTSVNYDALNESIKYWDDIKKEQTTVSNQESFFFWMRVVLFIIGSALIIISKLPHRE